MTSSFIVTLNVDSLDGPTLAGLADDIRDELSGAFDVVVVKPWAHPASAPQLESGFDIAPAAPGPMDRSTFLP